MTDDEYKTLTERGAKAWVGVTAAEIAELRDGGIAELELENKLLRARNERLGVELDTFRKDAEQYRWLVEHCAGWEWSPSRWSASMVCGFSAGGVSYQGYGFEESLAMAIARKVGKK